MIQGDISIYKHLCIIQLHIIGFSKNIYKINKNFIDDIFIKHNNIINSYGFVNIKFKIEISLKDKLLKMLDSEDSTIQQIAIDIILNNKI